MVVWAASDQVTVAGEAAPVVASARPKRVERLCILTTPRDFRYDRPSHSPVRAGHEETIERARVLPAAKSVVEKLQSMSSKPDEIEVNFGINLNTQAGAFIASASAEANLG